MKINPILSVLAGSIITPFATAFIGNSIQVMLPWLIAMLFVVLADLAAGIRKSKKLGVHVSITTAFRETMGKLIVYFGFVMAAAMVDVAANGNASITRWLCLFVCAMEGGSIISNLMRPYGIVITPKGILSLILKRSPLQVTDEEAEAIIQETREHENNKWNKK